MIDGPRDFDYRAKCEVMGELALRINAAADVDARVTTNPNATQVSIVLDEPSARRIAELLEMLKRLRGEDLSGGVT